MCKRLVSAAVSASSSSTWDVNVDDIVCTLVVLLRDASDAAVLCVPTPPSEAAAIVAP